MITKVIDMSDFPDRFVQLKKSKKVTFDELSKEFSIAVRTLKYYSYGQREPNVSTLIMIADYFDVSADYLIGLSDDPKRK